MEGLRYLPNLLGGSGIEAGESMERELVEWGGRGGGIEEGEEADTESITGRCSGLMLGSVADGSLVEGSG